MSQKKTPTSSLSAIELLTRRVWYRGLARIEKLFSASAPLEVPAAHSSPATKLPQEIVEIIIVHLIYDTRSLLACSLTCYSWYIASVPHLHHTLVTLNVRWYFDPKHEWPKPLKNGSKLSLLPLVKKLQICRTSHRYHGRHPKMLNRCTLHQFSALSNVQELEIDDLDIPNFIPRIRRYFGHFLPTLRSLSLRKPKGSCREIVFFIGLFQHLEDLSLLEGTLRYPSDNEPADDLTLVPPFIPPLRGRLTVIHFTRVGILTAMIDLFGRIRFRYMGLFDVDGMRLLLGACGDTLETLRLHPTDPRARSSLRDFDLSQNKSLRTLEIPACSIVGPKHGLRAPNRTTSRFLKTTLLTIKSPAFSEVIVVYRGYDFRGVGPRPPRIYRKMTPAERAEEASWYRNKFNVFRAMYTVRGFQLVLCADVCKLVEEYAVGVLKRAIAAEKGAKRLDYLPSEPSVIYSPRGSWDFGGKE